MNCMNGKTVNGVCTACRARGVTEKRPPNALPLGSMLHRDRYYIGRVLGSGGFGITYMAWDTMANRRVALKELYPKEDVYRRPDRCTIGIVKGQESYFEHITKRFLDEARTISSFQSEGDIINVYHLFSANNTAYYTMEFMEGKDLKKRILESGPMSWTALRPIALGTLNQLAALHRRGLLHRDVSPDNIFLLNDGRVKLIDFGSVRTYMGDSGLTTVLKHSFAPIEQYSDGKQGPWTDIYSLSVTLYYMLSGKLVPKALDRTRRDTVLHISSVVPGIPESTANAIMKGMAVYAGDRYSSAEEYARALGLSPSPAPYRPSRQPSSPQGALYTLMGVQGHFRGTRWTVTGNLPVSIGREDGRTITYPLGTNGVSRRHCTLAVDKTGRLCIRDDGSRYGTFVDNVRLTPGQWRYVNDGSIITFGQEGFRVEGH